MQNPNQNDNKKGQSWYERDGTINAVVQASQGIRNFCIDTIQTESWKQWQIELFVIPCFSFGWITLWSIMRRKVEPFSVNAILKRGVLATGVVECVFIPRHLRIRSAAEQAKYDEEERNSRNTDNIK